MVNGRVPMNEIEVFVIDGNMNTLPIENFNGLIIEIFTINFVQLMHFVRIIINYLYKDAKDLFLTLYVNHFGFTFLFGGRNVSE